jgi:hypothetical protein
VDGLHAFDGNLWKACEAANGVVPLSAPLKELDEIEPANWVARLIRKKVVHNTGGIVRRFGQFLVNNLDRPYHAKVVDLVEKIETAIGRLLDTVGPHGVNAGALAQRIGSVSGLPDLRRAAAYLRRAERTGETVTTESLAWAMGVPMGDGL